jgi:hypothetical protein
MGFMKSQRLALNMFWCAFLLWYWHPLPRETISGFFGRNSNGTNFASRIERFIDWLHPHEKLHCLDTYILEKQIRMVLYQLEK